MTGSRLKQIVFAVIGLLAGLYCANLASRGIDPHEDPVGFLLTPIIFVTVCTFIGWALGWAIGSPPETSRSRA
jgi:hypothetical protein